MKRKTAIKKLMGMGYSRNDAETKLFWARAFDWSNESVVMIFKVTYDFERSFMRVKDVLDYCSISPSIVESIGKKFMAGISAGLYIPSYDDHDISGLLEDY